MLFFLSDLLLSYDCYYNFRLCPQVVLDWVFRFVDQWSGQLTEFGLTPMALSHTSDHSWVGVPRSFGVRADWLAGCYRPCGANR